MKNFISVLILVTILLITFPAYAFQNEPDGFRGIAWNSVLSQSVKPTQGYYVCINSPDAKIQYPEIPYYNPSDTMQLGDSRISQLTYYSYERKKMTPPIFSKVNMYFEGESNVKTLEEYILNRFGPPTEKIFQIKDHNDLGTWDIMSWKGSKTILELQVLRPVDNGRYYATLWIMSNSLFDEIESKHMKSTPLKFNNGI